LGEFESALADYARAIELDPQYAAAYFSRGSLHASRGDNKQAIADFDQAIRYDARFAAAYYGRGRAWGLEGHYQRTLADLEKYLELSPRASNRQEVEALVESLRSRHT
jgi:tetratricopeptide (TPR) repeat protein